VLTLHLDKSVAQLRGVAHEAVQRVALPVPLNHPEELLRTSRTALERCQLGAPAIGMSLEAALITRAQRVQLDLSRDATASPDALPVLLAEVSAEIGPERVGTLSLQPSLRPELRSTLRPARLQVPPLPSAPGTLGASVTRLLPSPVALGQGPITPGRLVLCVPSQALEAGRVQFDARLDAVHWWTDSPVSRDYVRVWLRSQQSGATAWVYVDRITGESWLHGWLD